MFNFVSSLTTCYCCGIEVESLRPFAVAAERKSSSTSLLRSSAIASAILPPPQFFI
ncbi:hypothetical protein M378DRAFT_169748 [Amanita muscaria Koide BX008]|uniref:Uncharacterized protein n=1 Tax=Amanita muscaria (strain Koide BX008) TaxID=946122 RepID=A0A0C2WCS1_AMAMK|nr:hypothetical protein M378DRAFT_169748 [Amanita muscaria Koide BX008]